MRWLLWRVLITLGVSAGELAVVETVLGEVSPNADRNSLSASSNRLHFGHTEAYGRNRMAVIDGRAQGPWRQVGQGTGPDDQIIVWSPVGGSYAYRVMLTSDQWKGREDPCRLIVDG